VLPDPFPALIAEAERQNPYKPTIADRLIALAVYQPFRVVWCARTAWLIHRRWNAPKGHEAHSTWRQDWLYALTLADMLHDGPMLPSDAIAEDRQYWED